MKKFIFTAILALLSVSAFSQGRSISRKPKLKDPYITEAGDTLKVGQELQIYKATGDNNTYQFVQLLNNLNEPIQPATSKVALKKQDILFFKEEDGVYYAFTKFFSINVEMALLTDEIRITKGK